MVEMLPADELQEINRQLKPLLARKAKLIRDMKNGDAPLHGDFAVVKVVPRIVLRERVDTDPVLHLRSAHGDD